MKNYFLLLIFLLGICSFPIKAKKVRTALRIEKTTKTEKDKNKYIAFEGKRVSFSDTLNIQTEPKEDISSLFQVSFAGYDKEANSSKESFILINPSKYLITGYEVKIDYFDMQGRMLHSRIIEEMCEVPAGETRKFDLKSWDTQHTYYYYLGNEPKRVATPYQVTFTPITFWIKEKAY